MVELRKDRIIGIHRVSGEAEDWFVRFTYEDGLQTFARLSKKAALDFSTFTTAEKTITIDEEIDPDEQSLCTCGHVKSRHDLPTFWCLDCDCRNFQYKE